MPRPLILDPSRMPPSIPKGWRKLDSRLRPYSRMARHRPGDRVWGSRGWVDVQPIQRFPLLYGLIWSVGTAIRRIKRRRKA